MSAPELPALDSQIVVDLPNERTVAAVRRIISSKKAIIAAEIMKPTMQAVGHGFAMGDIVAFKRSIDPHRGQVWTPDRAKLMVAAPKRKAG